MGLKKIKGDKQWVRRPCMSPGHNPPSHMALSPGTYEWTCDACGNVITFTVSGPRYNPSEGFHWKMPPGTQPPKVTWYAPKDEPGIFNVIF